MSTHLILRLQPAIIQTLFPQQQNMMLRGAHAGVWWIIRCAYLMLLLMII
jgi:hypothetical protein